MPKGKVQYFLEILLGISYNRLKFAAVLTFERGLEFCIEYE